MCCSTHNYFPLTPIFFTLGQSLTAPLPPKPTVLFCPNEASSAAMNIDLVFFC